MYRFALYTAFNAGLVGFATYKTAEFFYVSKIHHQKEIFSKIPDFLKTNAMWTVAIRSDPRNINDLPKKLDNENFYLGVVQTKPKLIKLVPDRCRTDDIYLAASKNGLKLKNLSGVTMSGEKFNKLFGNKEFVKLTNAKEIHNGYQLKTGLNIDSNPGGIDFTEYAKKEMWIRYGVPAYQRIVTIPTDAQVRIGRDYIMANKVILGEKTAID